MIDKRFADLIGHLWRGGQFSYFWTPDDGQGNKYSYWLTVGGGDVPKLFEDKDAYFGINPSSIRRSEHERANNGDIAAINCFYCEFDCPTPEAKTAMAAKIKTWLVKPACVVDSGGGYHVYIWLRDTLYLGSQGEQQHAADLQWAFVQWAGGDSSVNDLARVLRIPGTMNHKPKYAPNFPIVTIVEWDTSQQYESSEIESLLQPYIDARNAKAQTSTQAASGTVSLSDIELRDVLFNSKNGEMYWRLYYGDLSDVFGDHSKADQTLANGLAWVSGRDVATIDRLFRQSALYRQKWERKSYREGTLNNAVNSAQTVYSPSQSDPQAQAVATAAVGMNGNVSGNLGSQPPLQNRAGPYKPPSDPQTADYIKALNYLGFHFRRNLLDDSIELNGQRLDDFNIRILKNRMRDLGFKSRQIVEMEDAYWEEAGVNSYHPIKEYLTGLQWDGVDHIRLLSRYFQDKHTPIVYTNGTSESVLYIWLKRWLIGAVAKVFETNGDVKGQNAVLVLEGGQNIGKSTFAHWLCSGVPQYFIEKSIEPDNKEDERRLASHFIWEIGELGATTRKADRELLKSFLSREECTFRNPYAHKDSKKPALASFIGTVNNEGGFLQDATGSRRFNTVGLISIQHDYITDLIVDQIWAQAFELYRTGEPWRLLPEEAHRRTEINCDYKVEDPFEGWVRRYFDIDLDRGMLKTPGWFTTTQEIVSTLKINGVMGDTSGVTNRLASTMKELGLDKSRFPTNNGPRGYWGLKIKP